MSPVRRFRLMPRLRQICILTAPAVILVIATAATLHSRRSNVAPEVDLSLHQGAVSRPDLCLSISLSPAAAYECGNLRMSHALPTTRTMSKDRTPVLTYNSQHANPYVLVPIHVRLPSSGTVPTKVTATLTAGSATATGTWTGSGWSAGTTRRVTVGFTPTTGSGVHTYSLEVTNWYGSTPLSTVVTGSYVVVDRSASPFGAGWWLAGLEVLDVSTMTLTDGGGGVRKYTSAGSGRWAAVNVDRPDSIVASGSNYIRKLKGGAQVVFNSAGAHVHTINAQNDTTSFAYSSGRLTTLTLPAHSSAPSYSFTYTSGYLTSVTAPGSRVTTIGRSGAVVTSIQDPGSAAVSFGSSNNRITSRTDRRGKVATFTYNTSTWRLSQSKVDPTGLDITTGLTAAEGRGYGSGSTAVASSSVDDAHSMLDGPRTDVNDHTRFWIDPFGAPAKIRDAASNETLLTRAHGTFPALVTEIQQPGGFKQQATYDTRGRITASTQVNPYGTGINATTTYAWTNGTCPDYVTAVTQPEGELTEFGYDTSCNRIWEQTGGSTYRVNFTYVNGQVTQVLEPGASQPYVYTYNTQGNVTQTKTPRGYFTLAYQDAVGRDTLTITPTDTVSAVSTSQLVLYGVRARTTYDAMNRPLEVRTTGPARTNCTGCQGSAADTLKVTNTYNADGALTQVFSLGTGNVYTGVFYDYDAAGRRIVEGSEVEQNYTYDPAGNVLAHKTGSHTVTMQYDALNRLTKRVVPSVQHAKTTCYPFGTLCTYKFPLYPNGPDSSLVVPADTQQFLYDVAGNMIEAKNRDAIVRRGYYPNGLVRADTQRIRKYSVEPGISGAYDQHVYALGYTYDRNGRRTALTYPTNVTGGVTWTTQNQYNTATGALQKVIAPGAQQWQFIQNAAGRDTLRTFPGGQERLGYDPDGQIRTRVQSTSGGIFRNDSYRYDARGKMIHAWGGPYTVKHWYSGLGSLIGTDFQGYYDAPSRTDYVEDYAVDALGSILRTRRHDSGYGYSPPTPYHLYYHEGSQLLSSEREWGGLEAEGMTSDEFFNEFDEQGNVLFNGNKRYLFGSGDGGDDPGDPESDNEQSASTFELEDADTLSFSDPLNSDADVTSGNDLRSVWNLIHESATRSFWSADNKLVVHQRYAGDIIGYGSKTEGVYEEYRYDALGRRVLVRSRVDGLCSGSTNCHSAITRYVWDGDQILFELRANGSNSLSSSSLELTDGSAPKYGRISYVHGPSIDQPLAVIRGTASSTPMIPHTNWRGSHDMGTNPDGSRFTASVMWPGARLRSYYSRERESEPISAWWGSLIMDQKDATGLMYRRNRYYDPATGRFTQQDPIGIAGGLNLYGYANGDPVTFADPFGLFPIGKIIKLGVRGFKTLVKNVPEESLVRAASENDDIIVSGGRQAASRIAFEAGDGGRPIHHNAHRAAGEGARPHYHPQGRTGHVFYGAASALTVSHHVSEDAPGVLKAGAAVIDFFNPLSLPKDIIDTARDVAAIAKRENE